MTIKRYTSIDRDQAAIQFLAGMLAAGRGQTMADESKSMAREAYHYADALAAESMERNYKRDMAMQMKEGKLP